MTHRVLECKYGGAVAWGKHYPSPGRDVSKAKNGSAPGYQWVRLSED